MWYLSTSLDALWKARVKFAFVKCDFNKKIVFFPHFLSIRGNPFQEMVRY